MVTLHVTAVEAFGVADRDGETGKRRAASVFALSTRCLPSLLQLLQLFAKGRYGCLQREDVPLARVALKALNIVEGEIHDVVYG